MKLFIIALAALNFAFASSFNFTLSNNSVSTNTSGNVALENNFQIEVMQVLGNTALIKLNGEVKEVKVRLVKTIPNTANTLKSYKAIVKSTILADMICDEREVIDYELSFTRFSNSDYSTVIDANLAAVLSYTYDWCHSSSDYQIINYTKL